MYSQDCTDYSLLYVLQYCHDDLVLHILPEDKTLSRPFPFPGQSDVATDRRQCNPLTLRHILPSYPESLAGSPCTTPTAEQQGGERARSSEQGAPNFRRRGLQNDLNNRLFRRSRTNFPSATPLSFTTKTHQVDRKTITIHKV